MKALTLLLALFLCLPLFAKDEPTALRKGVDAFLAKDRVLSESAFGEKATVYRLIDAVSTRPANDNARRVLENVIMRDAAKYVNELTGLAKQATGSSDDQKIIGQIDRVKLALDDAKKDKAKIAEAIRQIAALR